MNNLDREEKDARSNATVYEQTWCAEQKCRIPTMDVYNSQYEECRKDPDAYWAKMARTHLHWFRDFTSTRGGNFVDGDIRYFADGQLNVAYNCLDRHIPTRGNKVAIIHEADEPGHARKFTYNDVLREVCKVANVMKRHGVQRGDTVAIYMPMIPELAFVMLACARIGAVHSVVFAGFSADSLRERIRDSGCKWVFTADEGRRGGKSIPLKRTTDEAVDHCRCVQKVFVYERNKTEASHLDRDIMMNEELLSAAPYCPAETLNAEDPLFLLYTSGSTGRPKGLQHTQAGYLLYTKLTHLHVFDYQENDVYACVADCGWITGHSYVVYGPLANGATTVMFESTPTYPHNGRYWEMIQEHKITHFYTAPTAIRALMRFGTDPVEKFDLSSLRNLGTVGEPINPEAWRWYFDVVGKKRCTILDTYWQTETGGIIVTPLPGATPLKAGSATFPFFGIQLALLDSDGNELDGNDVSGVVCIKDTWPGIARTIYGDHQRYLATYMHAYKGYYFTGDGGYRDTDGYIWITGRVDDVLNVSGHRLGSAEIESCLVEHNDVAEAAVIGYPHHTKGEGICCYVTLKEAVEESFDLVQELRVQVRRGIGPFATPDYIVITPSLPKTRSGKIMRRVLRKIAAGEAEHLGDITTLADSSVVQYLIDKVTKVFSEQAR